MTMAPAQKPLALIAEDDRVLADVIRLAFVRAGFAVTVVTNGLKALQCAMAQEYDVIISDYQMPHLTGEQLLTQVRESGPSRQAVLLLCSAKAYELETEQLIDRLQLQGIFYKPFSLAEISTAARVGLENRAELSAASVG
jgi:CheY-like chemotaxis protein